MKWCKPIYVARCKKRGDCVSPNGHYGHCQVFIDGKLVFIDERSRPIESLERKPPAPLDSDDPFGWRKP